MRADVDGGDRQVGPHPAVDLLDLGEASIRPSAMPRWLVTAITPPAGVAQQPHGLLGTGQEREGGHGCDVVALRAPSR